MPRHECDAIHVHEGKRLCGIHIDGTSRNRAFTLIELLAATVIAAVLMVGVLVVVAQLGTDQQRLANHPEPEAANRIIELLQRDLAGATSIATGAPSDSIVMDGYGALSLETQLPTGRAAEISYRIIHIHDSSWLVRKQRPLDEPAEKPWMECVSHGMKHLTITPEARAGTSGKLKFSGEMPAMADCYRLQIEWSDTAHAPINELIILR